MRAMIVVAALLTGSIAHAEALVAAAGDARAEAVRTVRIGAPSDGVVIARLDVVLAVEPQRTVATLIVQLLASEPHWRDVAIPIEIPRGLRASGIELAGFGHGRLLERERASEDYRFTVEHADDPALLEWQEHTRLGDRLELRAFPVRSDVPMALAITLVAPRTERLAIDLGPRAVPVFAVGGRETPNASGRQTFSVRGQPPHESSAPFAGRPLAGAVDAEHSLVVGTIHALPELTSSPPAVPRVDTREVRDHVWASFARLRRCYTLAAERDDELPDGDVVLHFSIGTDGAVTLLAFGGELLDPSLHACLATEVAAWKFTPRATAVEVRHRLHVRLRR